MLFALKSSLVAGKGCLLASCSCRALCGRALPCLRCLSPSSAASPACPLWGKSSGIAPRAIPATDSPCPPAWDHLPPKSWPDWGNQSPGSAARHRIPVPLRAHALLGAGQGIAGCRSGYHGVHPYFLFALLSNHTGSWLAGWLAQARPGDPSAPPKSCCGVLLRLCHGLGCTLGTHPAARSLPKAPPTAQSLGSHFCVYLFLASLGTRLHEMLPKAEPSQATKSPAVL